MFERRGENMDIKVSQEMIKEVASAVAKLEQQETVTLEKPFEGFYATFGTPEGETAGKVFQIFSTAELGIGGEDKKVYLICENLLGNKT